LRGSRFPTFAGAAAIAFALAVAGASLLRSELTQVYVSDARSELAKHPGAAVQDARRAIRLDGASLEAYYLEAAGLARFDRGADARATLLQAAREDPTNFVTWTLLGDLHVRLRNFSAARSFYGRAHQLNPKDPALAQFAADPRTALPPGGGG
jgi:cytochrome c-type biogenesis protein CcmH/NrfG